MNEANMTGIMLGVKNYIQDLLSKGVSSEELQQVVDDTIGTFNYFKMTAEIKAPIHTASTTIVTSKKKFRSYSINYKFDESGKIFITDECGTAVESKAIPRLYDWILFLQKFLDRDKIHLASSENDKFWIADSCLELCAIIDNKNYRLGKTMSVLEFNQNYEQLLRILALVESVGVKPDIWADFDIGTLMYKPWFNKQPADKSRVEILNDYFKYYTELYRGWDTNSLYEFEFEPKSINTAIMNGAFRQYMSEFRDTVSFLRQISKNCFLSDSSVCNGKFENPFIADKDGELKKKYSAVFITEDLDIIVKRILERKGFVVVTNNSNPDDCQYDTEYGAYVPVYAGVSMIFVPREAYIEF